MWQHNITDVLSRHKSAKFHSFWIKNSDYMHYFIQEPSGIKCEKIAHLYPLGTFVHFQYFIRPKKKIPVFPLTQPTLLFCANPAIFIALQ